MKLDITSIIKDNGASIDFSRSENLKEFESELGTVTFTSPVSFNGRVTNNNGMLTLRGEAQVDYKTVCDRCEEELERHLTVNVHEDILERDELTPETNNASDDDRFTFSGHILDLDRIVADAVLLNVPMQHLCREDCAGLCTTCGARFKDDNQCECTEQEPVDLRFEVLKEFFKRNG